MEVHLSADVESRLNQAAAASGCDPEAYAERLIEHYLDYDLWFRQKVKKGLDSLDRGEYLTHREVGVRIERMFDS